MIKVKLAVYTFEYFIIVKIDKHSKFRIITHRRRTATLDANHHQWSIIRTSHRRRRWESTQYRSYKVRVCDTRDVHYDMIKAAAIVRHAVYVRLHALVEAHTHSWNVISLHVVNVFALHALSPLPRGIYKSILRIQSAYKCHSWYCAFFLSSLTELSEQFTQ